MLIEWVERGYDSMCESVLIVLIECVDSGVLIVCVDRVCSLVIDRNQRIITFCGGRFVTMNSII